MAAIGFKVEKLRKKVFLFQGWSFFRARWCQSLLEFPGAFSLIKTIISGTFGWGPGVSCGYVFLPWFRLTKNVCFCPASFVYSGAFLLVHKIWYPTFLTSSFCLTRKNSCLTKLSRRNWTPGPLKNDKWLKASLELSHFWNIKNTTCALEYFCRKKWWLPTNVGKKTSEIAFDMMEDL